MDADKKIIFIACGQRELREKDLGNKVFEVVRFHKNLEPFLAEDTHSFDGLTSKIFGNLEHCSGFIAILHQREDGAENPKFRNSSLWINQEIAIAAFLSFREKRDIPVRVFVETKGDVNVKVEGILKYIMANAIPFSSDEEVLEILKKWLDETKFSLREEDRDCVLASKRLIKLLPGYTGEKHTYRLDLEIANVGKKTARDVLCEVYFPFGIPRQEASIKYFDAFEPKDEDLQGYVGFKLKRAIDKILPGRTESVYCFDFIVNHDVYFDGHTHKNMLWRIFADNISPIHNLAPLEGAMGEGINF